MYKSERVVELKILSIFMNPDIQTLTDTILWIFPAFRSIYNTFAWPRLPRETSWQPRQTPSGREVGRAGMANKSFKTLNLVILTTSVHCEVKHAIIGRRYCQIGFRDVLVFPTGAFEKLHCIILRQTTLRYLQSIILQQKKTSVYQSKWLKHPHLGCKRGFDFAYLGFFFWGGGLNAAILQCNSFESEETIIMVKFLKLLFK